MSEDFRGTIAACSGAPIPGYSPGHDPESVWVLDLGDDQEAIHAGLLEFIAAHLACGTFKAESFTGPFEEFEPGAANLAKA